MFGSNIYCFIFARLKGSVSPEANTDRPSHSPSLAISTTSPSPPSPPSPPLPHIFSSFFLLSSSTASDFPGVCGTLLDQQVLICVRVEWHLLVSCCGVASHNCCALCCGTLHKSCALLCFGPIVAQTGDASQNSHNVKLSTTSNGFQLRSFQLWPLCFGKTGAY